MSQNFSSLTNQFLIAMPSLDDPNFFHSVTYICEHTEEGAMGIVINHPMDLHLGDVLEQMSIPIDNPAAATQSLFLGGPVQTERGFVIHEPVGQWESTLSTSDDIAITTSRDILAAIASGQGPMHTLVALGYAGWGPGQLEKEIADNAWLNGPMDKAILFEQPTEKRWKAAASLMGIDLNLLSQEVGHA